MDNKIVHAAPVPPFVTFVASAVPMVFDNSMSYYEALCALWKWLQDDVINVINNNATVTEEYIRLTEELKEFVENYFANLDVQEEINNKLDQMAEDGTLADIITAYLNQIALFTYDTVADMKSATNLIDGSYAKTLGYYAIGDGGSAVYYISDSGTADEHSVIAIGSTLYANLVPTGTLYPEMFGAYGDDSHDDYAAIQACFDYAKDAHFKVEFNQKTYRVSQTLKCYTECIYDGNNALLKGTADLPVIATAKYFDENNSGFNVTIKNFRIQGDTSNTNNDGIIICGWYDTIENINVSNVGGHGIVVTSYTNNGNEITGSTLVEGRIKDCKFYSVNSSKYPFYQHCNTIHITDWRITNSIFASNNCTEFMHFDRIAGWFLDDVQCYGKATEHGIYSKFASGTHMNNITVDGIMNYGVGIVNQIGSTEINNLHINIHSDVTTSNEIDLIHQTGGSNNPYPLQVTNVNARILGSDTPTNLYIHRGSGYIFDICNVVVTKGYDEVAYKTYQNKSASDIYRMNGFEISSQTVNFGNIATYAHHLSMYKYSGESTTLTMNLVPGEALRTTAILTIGGEVNGLERGLSVYAVSLSQRGTTQPIRLVSENSSYQFTNVSVTKDGSGNYAISATTPATSNAYYFMNIIY